ncbi:MAG: serine/threonine-protein kinase [Lysobacterales bacterium]
MSGPDHFERLNDLLSEALDASPTKRSELVERARQEDPELAARLLAMLERSDAIDNFLETDASMARDSLLADALAEQTANPEHGLGRLGQRLGSYRILRTIGEGLRSRVFLACREDTEWQQQVAIKILSRGVDTDDVMRRFLSERQILSELRHPNIATLLDGGTTEDGLPYFIMEYIDGLPITEHCRRHEPRLSGRVRLFREVCETVAFAQRHLVVHRDIKPSNILVTPDGKVKLLDFGIAKLLDPGDHARLSALTLDVSKPMTPAYASPEQISGAAVTTATDVYQLGLLLAEMLTGAGGVKQRLGIGPPDYAARPPSKAMVVANEAAAYAARDLRGDLDWIVLKALEVEPESRYGSAAKLQADVENYLEHRAVSARAPTPLYRMKKFVRRQPTLSVAAALAFLAVLGYIVTLAWFNDELERERTLAVDAADRAEEVKNLLVRFIASPDPYTGIGADARISDMLARSESEIGEELADRPQTQAELYGAVADVYQHLDLNDRAVAMLHREIETLSRVHDGNSLEVLSAQRKLSQVLMVQGKTDEALGMLNRIREALDPKNPNALVERAVVEREVGNYQTVYGDAAKGVTHLQTAVDLLEQSGDAPLETAASLYLLSVAYETLGRFKEGKTMAQRAYDIHVRLQGAEHVNALLDRALIATHLADLGHYQDGIAIYDEIMGPLEQRLGPLNNQTLSILNNVAYTHDLAGDLEMAAKLHEDVLARRRERFGDTHRAVADSLQNLGSIYTRMRRYKLAIPKLLEASRIYQAVNEPDNPVTAYPEISLAVLYSYTDEPGLLEEHARKAIELLRGKVPETHPAWLKSQCLLGDALIREGDPGDGIPLVKMGIRGLKGQANIPSRHLKDCQAILDRLNEPRLHASSG